MLVIIDTFINVPIKRMNVIVYWVNLTNVVKKRSSGGSNAYLVIKRPTL